MSHRHSSHSAPAPPASMASNRPRPSTAPSHDEISRRAYRIYVEGGRRDGCCEQNWHHAELAMQNEAGESIAAQGVPEANPQPTLAVPEEQHHVKS